MKDLKEYLTKKQIACIEHISRDAYHDDIIVIILKDNYNYRGFSIVKVESINDMKKCFKFTKSHID